VKLNIEKYGRWFINDLPQFNFENIDWEESTLALVYLPIHYDNSFFRLGVVSNNELGYIPTNVGFKQQGLPDKTIHLINSRRDSFTKLQSIIINELKQDIKWSTRLILNSMRGIDTPWWEKNFKPKFEPFDGSDVDFYKIISLENEYADEVDCFLHLKTIPLFHFKSIPL